MVVAVVVVVRRSKSDFNIDRFLHPSQTTVALSHQQTRLPVKLVPACLLFRQQSCATTKSKPKS
jgi:hypothetical protein